MTPDEKTIVQSSSISRVSRRVAARIAPPLNALGAGRAAIAEHTARSRVARDGVFGNRESASPAAGPDLSTLIDMARRPGVPSRPIPVLRPRFAPRPADLEATWLGHATAVVDVDGLRFVTDPVLSMRCSPSQLVGPRRLHRAPLTAGELPPVDAVVISHDHYDHLDVDTIVTIAHTVPDAVFVAPLGVGAHLTAWGVPSARIREADWYEDVTVAARGIEATLHARPARHFSGRGVTRNLTQWVSWAIVGPRHRVFFSGDTGHSDVFTEVGAELGPFDLALIAIGAYDPAWPDIHLNPEEALDVFGQLNGAERGGLFVPIHWGTFNLARHPWSDPVRRLTSAAARLRVDVRVPRPGADVVPHGRTGSAVHDPTWWERCA
ncbi:MBL fold metallo-hydrolase [Gordonia shandongensis]|uniref:MBL fold metallo-hydrolase n=1 Tax=Gordonia shandongensis TaxID=376351 RepID=UPI0004150016|nr:MBL fold metallo-hydrolase [Gordonia shandongensis]